MAGDVGERVVRVFVSSTFRDMAPDRDVLVRRVFPQVRQKCAERGVAFTEIDLRWGLTDEEVAEGRALELCLEEIDRCKPFFIGLLGERYGWVPSEVADDLAARQPWLLGHAGEASVTELEIRHGVLNDPEIEHARFYFRDSAYVGSNRCEVDAAAFDVDPAVYEEDPGATGAAERRQRLTDLKDEVRRSPHPVHDGYADPDELAELVLADLNAVIDQRFPAAEAPSRWEAETQQQELFADSRIPTYVGRASYTDALDDFVDDQPEGGVLTVVGESGSGKSALLATWSAGYASRHSDTLVLTHFAGSSASSTELTSTLGRLNHLLGRHLHIDEETNDRAALTVEGPDKDPARVFRERLSAAAIAERVLLVVDALNQLEDAAQDLHWLPEQLPLGVSLVVSALPSAAMDELRRRGWLDQTVKVRPLDDDERRQVVRRYLGVAAKQIADAHIDRIVANPASASPLHLRILLDELRTWGRHETLTARLDRLCAADTTAGLLGLVLEGYEGLFDAVRPGLVGEALSLIRCARQGLTESELADLLGDDGAPLPDSSWVPLRAAAASLLIDRAGLLGTAHPFVDAAIDARYLPTDDTSAAVHARLADWFIDQGPQPRSTAEAPHQLAQIEDWPRLAELLAEPQWFSPLWNDNKHDVKRWWARIASATSTQPGDAFLAHLDNAPTGYLVDASNLLQDRGELAAAQRLLAAATEQYRSADDPAGLQASLGNQAVIHKARGELDQAMELHKEKERICRELGDPASLSISLGNQAVIHQARGELDQAMELLTEQERICRELGDPAGLQRSLGNQAVIHQARGELDQAMDLHTEEERICRELGDPASLSISLGNQALIHKARGELDQAMELHTEQERICRELGDPASLQASLGTQALIHKARGELDQAMELLTEQERICRELGDPASLQRSFGTQALIHKARGELDQAMDLHTEEERICRELGDPASLQASLGNQALIHQARGELDQAMELHKEKERICRELGDPASLSISLGNQAVIHQARGELDQAMELHTEEERICRELGDPAGLARSLANQALLAIDRDDRDRAQDLLEEALDQAERSGEHQLVEAIESRVGGEPKA